jgi:hypothetical protein
MGIILTWLAILLALVAVAYGWKLQQELHIATRRLDRYNRALFDANDEISKVREELAGVQALLQAQIHLPSGVNSPFVPQMKVRDAVAVHPQAEQILAAFHLGGCNSCAVDPDDTLIAVCRENGRDLAQLLQNLNMLVATSQKETNGQPRFVKVPNVEVSF